MQHPPPILLQLTPQGLVPYGAYSAPQLEALTVGQVLTAKPRKGRSLPRNGAYWAGLSAAVKATEAWPTPEHLHADLKRLCGYVDVYHNPLTGHDEVRVQSTSFDKMTESEFAEYFRFAQARFIGRMGFDPWSSGMNLTGRPIYAKPEREARDPARMAKVADMPCCICHEYGLPQLSPTQVHHCIHGRYGTRRAPDSMTIPLCEGHHMGLLDGTKVALHRQSSEWRKAYGDDTRWISWTEERLNP